MSLDQLNGLVVVLVLLNILLLYIRYATLPHTIAANLLTMMNIVGGGMVAFIAPMSLVVEYDWPIGTFIALVFFSLTLFNDGRIRI